MARLYIHTCNILRATAGLPLLTSDTSLSMNTEGSEDTSSLPLLSMEVLTPMYIETGIGFALDNSHSTLSHFLAQSD